MPNRCDYVDPTTNFPCGKKTTLVRILIQSPKSNEVIVKYVCKIHGDRRFDYLSLQEDKLQKQREQNKIDSWDEFKEEMKQIRWKRCRRCLGSFEDTDIVCMMEWYYWSDTNLGLRRSFRLHEDCCNSEMKLLEIQKDPGTVNSTLDEHVEEPGEK